MAITVDHDAGSHAVTLHFAGLGADTRRRITAWMRRSPHPGRTHWPPSPAASTYGYPSSESLDALSVVESCAALLPGLEELHLHCKHSAPPEHQHALLVLLAGFLPRLRRLTLPARATHLAELTVMAPAHFALTLTDGMVDGFGCLRRLERLTLVCDGLSPPDGSSDAARGGGGSSSSTALQKLAATLERELKLQVDYAPRERLAGKGGAAGAGVRAAATGGSGAGAHQAEAPHGWLIRRLTFGKWALTGSGLAALSGLAAGVLAAAADHGLHRHVLPELDVGDVTLGEGQLTEALMRAPLDLVARAGRVQQLLILHGNTWFAGEVAQVHEEVWA
ncbi:hypothetical protein HYH02_008013 [Chlamydomonas schloesseri]|uniref:Uncharacterized protein n=1 Tax=Chlamydomonas schloesseri TaxID=2026947 RepID=A0A836B3S2_9CHLO|nr:hypothetical protein HYH02_008013 [Chlamydomonas schloesseri]|eukprot:KAG2446856.1 hypothetical protein HYH02_008013 [Chlamydomonas schloesseri]